ncbi:MAG: 23S rRNA (adenine(2503)-C(2))-methyltransferase RlmN [Lachnospiraceae bacterium]|nr:23S rRNA (adenine(2503)-C(2))-methyltransferase RlmN [Lachnospiraceae bacterium]
MAENGKDIKSFTPEELKKELEAKGEKGFRAKQMYEWMHKKLATGFDEMTNLPASLREKCKEEYYYADLEPVTVLTSKLDGTRKYLFRLRDGHFVESVWMKYHHGNSVCISSQVGCKMGCRFCASTLDGWERNLTPSEMLEQIYAMARDNGERVSNVVVMGTGEPLDNYENLVKFIRMLTNEEGLNISQRNVTVSTCGLVPEIRRLAEEDLSITLALSLHAPTDEKRKELMPIAKRYTLAEVMDACEYYFNKTGRRISFEYALVAGVNDNEEEAGQLISLIGGKNCHVNLIPVNPIKERDYVSTAQDKVLKFKNKLEKNHINATVRRTLGSDINASCGQLRKQHMEV